ncbi:MAG: co-chaperone YbbN [Magnetococcales bacterium]|nr:co-chaperone YbbN [Magnetococcales bacterium]NGZ25983.1 co-chaperone YbbN [Magnetococcales bacterium]
MANSKWVIDVNESNFNVEIVERSRSLPVLVDFWAPWCNPCRTLGPLLEKLANEMKGRFLLAKINSDQCPNLAQMFRVRSIPTVKLIVNGQLVDEFNGALPESELRQFIERNIPSPADKFLQQAILLEQRGDLTRAAQHYQAALEVDEEHVEGLLGLARVLIALQQPADARAILSRLKGKDADAPEAKRLLAMLKFNNDTSKLDDLRSKMHADPDDLALRIELGKALVGNGDYEEGMDLFLYVVKKDRSFQEDAGRRAMIEAFDLLGPKHPLVPQYRSRLSALLFS